MRQPYLETIFLTLTFIGIVVPYAILAPFIAKHGLDFTLITHEIVASRIALFAWVDVVISAAVLLFASYAMNIIRLRQAFIITFLTCLVGVSASLPLFFYFMLRNQET